MPSWSVMDIPLYSILLKGFGSLIALFFVSLGREWPQRTRRPSKASSVVILVPCLIYLVSEFLQILCNLPYLLKFFWFGFNWALAGLISSIGTASDLE